MKKYEFNKFNNFWYFFCIFLLSFKFKIKKNSQKNKCILIRIININ